jgi:ABC-type transport system substrate-binding protein
MKLACSALRTTTSTQLADERLASSAGNQQWYPNLTAPATPWEADRLIRAQAATTDREKRKAYFRQGQEIVWEQAPFLYLVTKNSFSAVSPKVCNAAPAMIRPQTYWNADRLALTPAQLARNTG